MFPITQFPPLPEGMKLSGDGKSVIVVVPPHGALADYTFHVYDIESRTSIPIDPVHELNAIQVVNRNTVIARRHSGSADASMVQLDLLTGQTKTIATADFPFASPDGKYLLKARNASAGSHGASVTLRTIATGVDKTFDLPNPLPSNYMTPVEYVAPNLRTVYYAQGTSATDRRFTKIDLFTGVRTDLTIPEGYRSSGIADALGDLLIIGDGGTGRQRVWNTTTGALTPLYAGAFGSGSADGVFLSSRTALIQSGLPLVEGDPNPAGLVVGTIGGSSWRPLMPPFHGVRDVRFNAITPDGGFSVVGYLAMGNEAGGSAFGFLRKNLQTGAFEKLPGRSTAPWLQIAIQVSDGGKKALLQDQATKSVMYRDMETGSEIPITFGGRAFWGAALAPAGDEIVCVLAKTSNQPEVLVRWKPDGSYEEIPKPPGVMKIGSVSTSGGTIALLSDSPDYRVAVRTGSSTVWRAIPFVEGANPWGGIALTHDGSKVSVSQSKLPNPFTRVFYTRVARTSDGKTLKTHLFNGRISGDGQWLLNNGNEGALHIPTGVVVPVAMPRSDEEVDFAGPWLTTALRGVSRPMAYRIPLLRAPVLDKITARPISGGRIQVDVVGRNAGIDTSPLVYRYRIDDGAWLSSSSASFVVAASDGPHRIELYGENAQGRRSATGWATAMADSVPPTISNMNWTYSGTDVSLTADFGGLREGSFDFSFVRMAANDRRVW
ncbi:hypothetical protein EON79_16280, partial [bacterium]